MKAKKIFLFTIVATFVAMISSTVAMAQTVVITPANAAQQGWSTADTRPGGAINFVEDATAPGGAALQLTTNGTNAAKAQFMHEANIPLGAITQLSYSTRQVAGPVHAAASYQLPVCLGGFTSPKTPTNPTGCTGFTTFVYEPYQNGAVLPNVWQNWDVDAGQFWSSRSYSDLANGGTCNVVAGGGGAPFYTLSQLQASCPAAVVTGFGVNIGSFNPGYNVYADLVNFNGIITDFQVYNSATNAEQCKGDGWRFFNPQSGPYRNQGQCVSSVQSNRGGNH
jgi:hypothetical protein